MKILIVRNYASELNIENYNSQELGMAKAFIEKGYQCDIIYYTKSKKPWKKEIKVNDEKITIFYEPAVNFMSNSIYFKLLKNDFFSQYDIIQSSEYNQIMTLLLSSKYKNKVILYHGPYTNEKRLIKRIFYEFYDRLFIKIINKNLKGIISKSKLATEYLERKGFTNITTVGVGLDGEKLGDLRKSKNIIPSKELLYIGQLNDRKNILFIFKLLREILKKDKKFKLTIIGDGKLEDKKRYFKYAEENNLLNSIDYIQNIPQNKIKEKYLQAGIFLLPSKEEIFGMVLLESMYFGVPVFSSYNGGSSTVIKNGINGFVFKEFDEKIWSKKILELMKDSKKYKKVSLEAQKIIKSEFSWLKIVENYIELYLNKIN